MNQSSNPFDHVATEYDAWYDEPGGRDIFNVEVACLRKVMPSKIGRWLEVGVGSGRFAAALGVAEGIDPSTTMLVLAQQRGIRTVNAVGECIPYADQTFDGILMTTALCFMADPAKALAECHRVLKDTGRVVVGLIPADSSWGRLYARKAAAGHPIYTAATFRTVEDVVALAVDAGFEILEAWSCLMGSPDSTDSAEQPQKGIVPEASFMVLSFKPVAL